MKINNYKCNKCGKDYGLKETEKIPLSINHKFQHPSIYDGKNLEVDFCPDCADKFTYDLINECSVSPINDDKLYDFELQQAYEEMLSEKLSI